MAPLVTIAALREAEQHVFNNVLSPGIAGCLAHEKWDLAGVLIEAGDWHRRLSKAASLTDLQAALLFKF